MKLPVKIRRNLPVAGYIVLTLATGYTFERQHENVISARDSLAQTTYHVLFTGCQSGNDLRRTLQAIIVNPEAIAQERKLVKEGKFSQADLNRSLKLARKEAATVAPRDCKKAYTSLKP
jgi:hypothetical protein